MSDFVKGKLEIVQVSVSTYQIWAKPKPNRKALLVASNLNEDDAKELVRRWNAFDELKMIATLGLNAKEALLSISKTMGLTIDTQKKIETHLKIIKAAIAKVS